MTDAFQSNTQIDSISSTNKVSNIYTISTRRPSQYSNRISLSKKPIFYSNSEISLDNFDIIRSLKEVYNSEIYSNMSDLGDIFVDYFDILSELKALEIENCILRYEIHNRKLESGEANNESIRSKLSKISFQTQYSNSTRTHLSSRMSFSYNSAAYCNSSLKLNISQKLRISEKVKSFLIDCIQEQQSKYEDEINSLEVSMSYYDEQLNRLKLRTKLLNTRPNLKTIYTKTISDNERKNQILIATRSNDFYRKRLRALTIGLHKESNQGEPCSVFEYQQLKYETLKLREAYIQKQEIVKSYKTLLYKIEKAIRACRKRIENEQLKRSSLAYRIKALNSFAHKSSNVLT